MGWQWNAESLRIFDSSNLPETYERDKVISIEAWEITWLCFLQNEQADITKLATNDYKRIKKKGIISIIVICMSAICEPVVKTDLEKHVRSQCLEADVGKSRICSRNPEKSCRTASTFWETPTRISKKTHCKRAIKKMLKRSIGTLRFVRPTKTSKN